MAKTKKKRRLTKEEVKEIQDWMNSAPMDKKPTIRMIAKRYGTNQPSVVKSLGGWEGVHRGKPEPDKEKKVIDSFLQSPIEIESAEMKTRDIKLSERG